ncbi:unnamed protein product [Mesocestoides corti]|uniref:Uncharacterized protein n=1 Tax=Mesocestoides corti TaxID=53468 RepID=A0A0R3UPF1_MESCO|nr:unnamed protein product [Mesocestoides corti]
MEEASRDLSINRNRCAVLSESTTSGEWGLLKSPGRQSKLRGEAKAATVKREADERYLSAQRMIALV